MDVRHVALFAACSLLVGCFSRARASSGKVGCSSDDITISEESDALLSTTETWTATCHGRVFRCSRTKARTDDISCTEDSEPTATAATESSSSSSTMKWQWIERDGIAFGTPGEWSSRKSPDERALWYAPDGVHGIAYVMRDLAGSLNEHLKRFGDRDIEKKTVDEAEAALAFGYYEGGHVTTLVVARANDVFELSCYDVGTKEQSSICTDVLESFTLKPKKKKAKG